MINERLQARLNEIAELATFDDERMPESQAGSQAAEPNWMQYQPAKARKRESRDSTKTNDSHY